MHHQRSDTLVSECKKTTDFVLGVRYKMESCWKD